MKVRMLKTELDHREALARIEVLMNRDLDPDEADELELLGTLVELYEDRHEPVPWPDPVEAIRFRMEQLSLSPQDLVPIIGSRSRVSEILHRKRGLTLGMIRRLHDRLGIPLEVLVAEPARRA